MEYKRRKKIIFVDVLDTKVQHGHRGTQLQRKHRGIQVNHLHSSRGGHSLPLHPLKDQFQQQLPPPLRLQPLQKSPL